LMCLLKLREMKQKHDYCVTVVIFTVKKHGTWCLLLFSASGLECVG
jgi:hypothetical protein